MSFDRVAPHYRWLETTAFGSVLHRARIYWLDEIDRPKRTLIVGEGNGRFLCELLRVHPRIDIDCVDASPEMLRLARTRLRQTQPDSLSHVRFFCDDILKWSPPESYDLLVTHFFLDCFANSELRTIIAKLTKAARPGAVWLIADFSIPPSGLARIRAQLWLRLMYAFFRTTASIAANRLVDPVSFLTANGFVRAASHVFEFGMLRSDLFVSAVRLRKPEGRIDRSRSVASTSRLPMEMMRSA